MRKLTVEQVSERIQAINSALSICFDTYINTTTKCLFTEEGVGDFWCKPNLILGGKQKGHPDKGQERRRGTSLERYGTENPTQNQEVRNRTRQTNIEKYGSDNPMQNPEINKKARKTYISRYGNKSPQGEKAYKRAWKETNGDKVREASRAYERQRKLSDPLFKLTRNLRTLIRNSLKNRGYTKRSRTNILVGLDFETLKNHLEYTWFQNYGTDYIDQSVHIDHIVPCSTAKTEAELLVLQHWTNLQYLTPEDNLLKSDFFTLDKQT